MADSSRQSLVAYARQVAQANGVDPNIFVAQIQQESGFDPTARNPSGANGIAQLMKSSYPNVDASDPYASLDAAAQTMGQNLQKYNGDYAKALAAYNAGGGAVDKYGGVPPFAETQAYVKNILGRRETTMGQMQDPGGSTTGGTTGTLSPADFASVIAAHGGYVGMTKKDRTIPDPDFPDRRKMDTASPWPTLQFELADGKKLNVHFDPRSGTLQEQGVEGGWAVEEAGTTALTVPAARAAGGLATSVNTRDQFLPHYDPVTKTTTWEPNKDYIAPAPPKITSQNTSTSDKYVMRTDPTTGEITWVPNQNYVDPSVAAKYVSPEDSAYKQAQTLQSEASATEAAARTKLIGVQTQAAQQGLRPTAQAAIQDAFTTIESIHQQLIAGQITPQEANTLAAQVHAGLSATLAGTTLFEQQKQAQDTATQRASQATSLLNQRVSSAASLGSSLFSSATGHVLMPAGQTTLGIDPMGIANDEINKMGGGQVTGDNAAAFLRGLFGGGGGGDSSPSGAPGGGQDQFPTTREDVLAQYPHLAQQFPSPTMGAQQQGIGQQPVLGQQSPTQGALSSPGVTLGGQSPGVTIPPNGNLATLLASIGQR